MSITIDKLGIYRDGTGKSYHITEIPEDDNLAGYDVEGKCPDGTTRSWQRNGSYHYQNVSVYDLVEYLDPKKYPEEYL